MKHLSLAIGALVVFVFSFSAHVAAQNSPQRASSAGPELDLDRLYSLPNLIGTAPSAMTWSADGRWLAFLWNEDGESFRDVYLVDSRDPALTRRRRTRMPRLSDSLAREIAATEDRRVLEIRAEQRRALDPGVTAVEFLGDHLVVVFRGDLYAGHLEGNDELVRLTETAQAESAAKASPDGRSLAFSRQGELWLASDLPSAKRTAEDNTVEKLAEKIGDARRATEITTSDGSRYVSEFRWSPDSRRISIVQTDQSGVALRQIPDYLTEETSADQVRRAYPGEEPTRQRLGLIDLAGGAQPPYAVLWPETGDGGGTRIDSLLSHRWSPDGRYVAVDTGDLQVKDRRILRVDAASGAVDLWAREQNPRAVSEYFWRIEWAPDSQGLYVISDFLGAASRGGTGVSDYHLFHLSMQGEVSQLTAGPFAVAELEVLPHGVLMVSNRGAGEERHLDFLPHAASANRSENTPLRRVSQRAGTHQPTASPDGLLVADLFTSDDTPPDLFLTAVAANSADAERRLTESPIDEFDRYQWAMPRYVTFTSRVDGATLHGRLTVPPDYDETRKYPAILGSVYTDSVRNQWGGRTAHPTWGLDQFLVQQGYVLLNVDMRGSWGRGREFREGIELAYGGPDVEDLASGVDFLATLGFVDMERIGIWGSSYGGLMTCMSLFKHPELYAAGFAGAPATNVWHALTGQMAVMMDPADQAQAYAQSSAYLHASGLEDPLMILHGMRDRVVLFKDSVRLVDHLILLGKQVDFVPLPDAYHGWDMAPDAQTRFAFRKLVDFFDRHLRPAARGDEVAR